MDFGTYSSIVIGRALEGFVLPVLSRWALDLGLALPPGLLAGTGRGRGGGSVASDLASWAMLGYPGLSGSI